MATELRVSVPRTSPSGYRVRIAPGELDRLGEHCAEHVGAVRYAVVADERVGDLYGDRALGALGEAGDGAELFVFPPGEASKTRETWRALTDRLVAAGIGRDGAIVALGGGVTGDLAGIVAATFLRGVPAVQVPTSLLAMVDSSVGGKTAVDTPAGKNLVGAFHHPAFVLVDPELLGTLPREHLTAGLAEGVKAAAIGDRELLDWVEERAEALVEADPKATARLIHRSLAVKVAVVQEDPGDEGLRAVLNFGHTVGHVLEVLAGYELLHGRAVAAGMRVEARLGEALGVTEPETADRLASILDACGHRDRPEASADPGSVLQAARVDKKVREGGVRVVLLRRPGEVARTEDGGVTHELPEERAVELLADALRPAAGGPDFGPGPGGAGA